MDQRVTFLISIVLDQLGLPVVKQKVNQLGLYTEMILEGLNRQRLVGEKNFEDLINRQIYDSLYPLKNIAFKEQDRLLDLGSGAGLPGMPLKIIAREAQITFLDANRRKVEFLRNVSETLSLERTEFLWGRAETFGQDQTQRAQYDYLVSKAVAGMPVLVELGMPFLKVGGLAIFYKGPKGPLEAEEAKKALQLCGAMIEDVVAYQLPSSEKRLLFMIRKHQETDEKYPRKEGIPARRPLR